MKEIELPSVPKFMVSFDLSSMTGEPSIDESGQPWLTIGTIDFEETNKLLTLVKSNGAKVLYATTWLETRLDEVLMLAFMGGDAHKSDKNYFFKHEVLESSGFSFSFKKETSLKLINQFKLLKGKSKDKLQKHLKKVMVWRNAFAHGTLGYDGAKGCFIDYYQGGQMRLDLNDEFWNECEVTFNEAHDSINEILKKLREDT